MSKLTRNVVWFLEPERPNCKIVRGVASLWNIELTRQLLTYFSVPGNLVISVVFRVLQKSQWQTCRSCAKSSCKWFSSLLLEESRVRFEWRSCHLFMKNLFYRLVPRRDTPNAAQCATAKARIGVCNYVSRSSQSPSYSFPHAAAVLSVGQSVGTNH